MVLAREAREGTHTHTHTHTDTYPRPIRLAASISCVGVLSVGKGS